MNTENTKMNEPQKFVLNLSERLDLRGSSNMVLFKTYLFITSGKIQQRQYTNNKLKIIQDYIEYIIQKQETPTKIPPIHVYINRINNRLVFKIKDGYKLELKTSETMKLFDNTKEIIEKTKNTPCLGVAEVVLVQCNLVDNQYQQKSEVLCFFVLYLYAYLLNVEPSNLVFLKTYNTEFDEIIIIFTDQNGRLLEIEDKVI